MIPKKNFCSLLYLIIICCFSAGNIYAQCDVQFTDNGGLDNPYNANADTTYTFCPDVAGDVVTVTFTFVDIETTIGTGNQAGCWDFLSIYNGSNTSTPLQQTACGELDGDGGTPSDTTSLLQAGDFFISSAVDGCLTITFNSDGAVQGQGWVADVSCGPPPECAMPIDLSADNITDGSADLAWFSNETLFNIEWGLTGFVPGSGTVESGVGNPYTLSGLAGSTTYDYYVCAICDDGMGGTISSECTGPFTFVTDVSAPTCSSGLFFDNGGPAAAYAASSSDSIIICPDVVGDVVTVTFTFVDLETTTGTGLQGGCWDFLSIFDGSGTTDTLQMTACGELDGDGSIPSVPESLLQAGDSFTSTAADGCLTFTFNSDSSAQEEGWEATVTCAPPAGVSGCTDSCATNYDPAATMDDGSCILPEEPVTECYEIATFNDATCVWDVTGEMPAEPPSDCFETPAFDTATCAWLVTGVPPPEPTTECYETATFNGDSAVCDWIITGEQPPIDDGCDLTDDSFDDVNCVAVNTSNCPDGTTLDVANCECTSDFPSGCTDPCASNYDPNAVVDDGSCELPAEPTTECYETATFNTTTCQWEVSGEQPEPPVLECYQTAIFDDANCQWEVASSQPPEPQVECYETATFSDDPAVCDWVITGDPPVIDDGCEFTDDSFDNVNCVVINTPNCPSGIEYDAISCECITDVEPGCTDPCATNYDPTALTDDGSCILPTEPTTACYETATFNTSICIWEVTGTQPPVDDGCDITDDSFDNVNCVVVNTPNCPADSYDAANCACTGMQSGCTDPTACNYDINAVEDDGSCIFPGYPCDDGDPNTNNDVLQADCTCVSHPPMVEGCVDPTACNFDSMATTDDGSCVFATGCDTCAGDGTVLDNPEVGEPCNDGDDNTENDTIQSNCICVGIPITGLGCTNAAACNYEPMATVDNGLCTFPGDACNDENSFTVNDTLQIDCSCEGTDLVDGVPTVSEWGLIILALILLNLGVLYIRQTEMRIVND